MKFTFKKTLAVIIVACMLLSALPLSVAAADTTVTTWAGLASAVASASAGDTITLGANLEATSAITVGANVTINGGKTITRAASCADNVFVVNGTLTLENVTINGNRTSTAVADLANALVVVNSGATFNMDDGAKLTTNRGNAVVSGAGVNVNGGTFNMYDGAEIEEMHIHNAKVTGARNVGPAVSVESGAFNMYGGTIHNCDGTVGAVTVFGGTFTMEDGEISGNIANNNGVGGGAVYNVGTFTMTGGTITGNTSWLYGGGVYNEGTFDLIDGTISNNGTALQGSTTASGGGIYTIGTLNISGGEITGNTAQSCAGGILINGGTCTMSGGTISGNSTSAYSGGGVFVDGTGSFSMTGGEIVNNAATQLGGGIAVTSTASVPINVTGGRILGNTCGSTFGGADIYVTTDGNKAATTLGSGCVADRLYLDNKGSRYSASNAQAVNSSSLTKNYGYIYVTNGASHSFGEWAVTTPAGCTTTGLRTRTCTICGTTEEEVIAATGHTVATQTVPATCTQSGYVRTYCSVCGTELSRTDIPATGHTTGKWFVTRKATASVAGTKVKYCKTCGATAETASYSVNDPAISVSFAEPEEYDANYNTVTATVSIANNPGLWALGFYFYYDPAFTAISAVNGNVFPNNGNIGAVNVVSANDPLVSAAFAECGVPAGSTRSVCFYAESDNFSNITSNGTIATVTFKYSNDLDDTYEFGFVFDDDSIIDSDAENVEILFIDENAAIEPIIVCDHTPGAWTTASAATCTEEGLRTRTCTKCGKIVARETIAALGHSAGDWVITVQPGYSEGERVKYCTRCNAVVETEVLRPTMSINIIAGDVVTSSGSTASVDLTLENNPGIWGMRVFLYYSSDISVTSVTNGVVFPTSDVEIGDLNIDPYTNYTVSSIFSDMGITAQGIRTTCIYFEASGLTNVTGNGKLATYTFNIPEGLTGEYVIGVLCDDAINEDLVDLSVNTYDATITLAECLHTNSSWVQTVAPTCTAAGTRSLVCSDCGAVLDTQTIPANGHTFSDEWTIDVEPTATTPGIKSHHCIYCDAVTDETEIEPLTPVLPGDVNGDGKFNSKDIALMKRVIAGTAAEGSYNAANADLNGDGKYTNKDLSALKKIVAQGG
ncbi:MAG: hypothetical protein IJT70_03600 [Clostridia bacterium]|nr:hypothetical protein [Clostridia bacterium]